MHRRAWLFLGILAALWGASYLFIKLALEDLSPAMIVLSRTALAALVLVPLAATRRGALTGLSGYLGMVLVLAAVQVAAPFLLISAGEQEISSSLTGILVASTPLFTALLAVRADHEERSSGLALVGVVAGFVGVGLLIGVDLGGDAGALLGAAAVLLASLGYAIGGFIVKRSATRVDPVGLAAGTMVASTVMVAPPALTSAPASIPGLEATAAMLALGIAGTGIAFALFHTLIADVGPARASLVTYIAPAFAVLYGVTLLGEPVTAATMAGLALIVGGSWLGAGGRLPGGAEPAGAPEAYVETGPPTRAAEVTAPRRRGTAPAREAA
jgi:drug/metabolite transporter (DMT)-like permease